MAFDDKKQFKSHYITDKDVIFSSERTQTGEYSFVKLGFNEQYLTMSFSKGGGVTPAKDAFLKLSFETSSQLVKDLADICLTRQNEYVKKENYKDFEIKYEFGFKDKESGVMRKTGLLELKTKDSPTTGRKNVVMVYTSMDTSVEYEIVLGVTFLADSYTTNKPGYDVKDARLVSLLFKIKSVLKNWMVLQQNESHYYALKKMLEAICTKLGCSIEPRFSSENGFSSSSTYATDSSLPSDDSSSDGPMGESAF